jgi:hypothetical protein
VIPAVSLVDSNSERLLVLLVVFFRSIRKRDDFLFSRVVENLRLRCQYLVVCCPQFGGSRREVPHCDQGLWKSDTSPGDNNANFPKRDMEAKSHEPPGPKIARGGCGRSMPGT